MENSKIINIHLEEEIAIRTVADPSKADIIVSSDGKITLPGVQLPKVTKVLQNEVATTVNINNNEVNSLECDISNMIISIGIPAHIKGYAYTREAIKLIIKDLSIMDKVTKELYPEIAEKFNTTSSRVERAIRHAIEVAWARGNKALHEKLFKFQITATKKKPTNSEFLSGIAEQIRLQRNTIG